MEERIKVLNQEFDHIISLGGHCQTAYQIRRYFNIDTAYPFDWWVTPTVALVDLFESGFANLFREENMKIVQEETGPAVMCSHYGIMHYHDFDEAKINGVYNPYLVRSKCNANNSKYSYLVKKLISISGRVLFIRFSHGWAQFYDKTTMFNDYLLTRLIKSINNNITNIEFNILLLNDYNFDYGMDGNPIEKIYTSVVNNYEEKQWHGSNQGWDELFSYHGIKYNKNV